jgi:hypothetical protein
MSEEIDMLHGLSPRPVLGPGYVIAEPGNQDASHENDWFCSVRFIRLQCSMPFIDPAAVHSVVLGKQTGSQHISRCESRANGRANTLQPLKTRTVCVNALAIGQSLREIHEAVYGEVVAPADVISNKRRPSRTSSAPLNVLPEDKGIPNCDECQRCGIAVIRQQFVR